MPTRQVAHSMTQRHVRSGVYHPDTLQSVTIAAPKCQMKRPLALSPLARCRLPNHMVLARDPMPEMRTIIA